MTDTELLDFVEQRGIQIFPQRKSKHGPVIHWWVVNPTPFFETYGPTLRGTLTRMKEKVDEQH